MLYDPVIYLDIFRHGTGLSGWHLNAAPNFFPDMFFYSILMLISGNFITANFLFSIFQYLSILLLIFWLFRQTERKNSLQYATAFNFLMFLYLLIPVFTQRFHLTFQVISISYHIGSFIMFLLSLNLLIMFLRKRSRQTLILLFISTLLGVFNDRLFISQFIFSLLPLTILMFNRAHRKALMLPISMIILATILGLVFFRFLKLSNHIHIIDTGFKMFNFENLSVSWNTFIDYLLRLFRNYHAERGILIIFLLSLILAIIYIVFASKKILAPSGKDKNIYKEYLIIIITAYLPITLLTPVINGAFVAISIIRFNIMAFYMGIMLLPLILSAWERTERFTTIILKYALPLITITFIVIFITRIMNVEFSRGLNQYFNFYPEKARIVDQLKEEHNLKYGIGDYWYSKYITMFSRNDVRIYAVFGQTLRPFYHSTNENWYHDGGKGKYRNPVFNFTVRKIDSDPEILRETFQEKIDTLHVNDKENYIVLKLPEFKIDRKTRNIILME